MSNINSLYQNGAGSLASFFAGQEQGTSQQKQELALQFERQKMDQDAQMHPLKMERERATLDQMGAQLPGFRGQSQSLAAAGEVDQATKTQKIAASISEMAGKIGDDGMKALARDSERVRQAAVVLEKLPPAAHKQAYAKFVEQYGGDIKSPMVQGVMSAPDEQFLGTLKAMGDGMATASAKYIQEMGLKKEENTSQEKIATDRNASAEKIAKLQADARIKAAESRSELAMSKMSTDQKIAYLTSIPKEERTPAESGQLNELSNQRLAEKTAGNNSVAPTVLGQPTNQQNARSTANELFPAGQAPTPKAPAPNAVAGNDPKAFAKANGLPYDDSKYQYMVVNGQLLKKPK